MATSIYFVATLLMEIIKAIILGIVQGLTEFIPVSSSGHLELFRLIFGWETENQLAFDVMVHMGTLGAIILFFWKEVQYLAQTTVKITRRIIDDPSLIKNVERFGADRLPVILILGTIPVGLAGIMLGDQLADASGSPYVIGTMLILVGGLMWFVDKRFKVKKALSKVDYYDGLMIGASQALALIKGTSRSGITMTTGRFLGYSLADAAKFSFLLGIPSIGAAGAYKILQLIGNPGEADWLIMTVGFITSFVSGYFAIRLFMNLLNKVGIKPFVIYRVALGAIVIVTAIVMQVFS